MEDPMDDLKTFHVRGPEDCYAEDTKRIRDVVRAKGYQCSLEQAKALWSEYSDSMAAGWLHLPDDDDELFGCISHYIIEDSDERA